VTLSDIWTGKIMTWNDPRIQALNPELVASNRLPSLNITRLVSLSLSLSLSYNINHSFLLLLLLLHHHNHFQHVLKMMMMMMMMIINNEFV
jgi:hypothetical protein